MIYTAPEKKGSSLEAFWTRLKRSGTNIEAVVTDMGMAYFSAVQIYLLNAVLVIDHFHVIIPIAFEVAGLLASFAYRLPASSSVLGISVFKEKSTPLRRELFLQQKTKKKNTLKGASLMLLKKKEI